MSLLSVRIVFEPVNNLIVISGHLITLLVNPVLSRKDTTQCPGESRTSGPPDISFGYI